ncbi:MAG: hypothetical protein SPI30_05545 [Prevotella sp.]|nr:hypothetical protein [Prevotella sp.]
MKKITLFILMFVSLMANAQDAREKSTSSISLELFGVHSLIGINYDTRLKGNDGWGHRIGFGYTNQVFVGTFEEDQSIEGFSIPLEVNYLKGNKNHKLELGAGLTIGLFEIKEKEWVNYGFNNDAEKTIKYFFFGNVGYRFQPVRDMMFRVGVTPSFNFGGTHGLDRTILYPYIGLGWAF